VKRIGLKMGGTVSPSACHSNNPQEDILLLI
jgi:hypothetical protein